LGGRTAVTEDYLEQIQEGISTQYGVDVKVTKGYWLSLAVTYSDDESEYVIQEYARVYKINGRWVVLDVPGVEE